MGEMLRKYSFSFNLSKLRLAIVFHVMRRGRALINIRVIDFLTRMFSFPSLFNALHVWESSHPLVTNKHDFLGLRIYLFFLRIIWRQTTHVLDLWIINCKFLTFQPPPQKLKLHLQLYNWQLGGWGEGEEVPLLTMNLW